MKDSSPGPLLDQKGGPRAPDTPVHQRWPDKDIKHPIANPRVSPVAEVDPYRFNGKTGQKL
jgi:hypothetical protein